MVDFPEYLLYVLNNMQDKRARDERLKSSFDAIDID
jgi:hypothetical protein